MPKKASTSNVVKRSVGNKKASKTVGKPKKAPVTKERELTKSLIETLKKEAKSKGVTLKSLLTEKEIKILTERAHNKAFETAGKKVRVTKAEHVKDVLSKIYRQSGEYGGRPIDEVHEHFKEQIKLSANKKYAIFEIKGGSTKLVLPKEEVLKLLLDKRIFKDLRIYSWDFGELFKDMKYNSSPKAKEYFDTLIKAEIGELTEYKEWYDEGFKYYSSESKYERGMERQVKISENMIQGLSKAGVPIEKLEPFVSEKHVPIGYLKYFSEMLVKNYGFNEYISKIVPGKCKNLNRFNRIYNREIFNSGIKGVLVKIRDPKTAIEAASKVLTLTETSEIWKGVPHPNGYRKKSIMTDLPVFCEVLGKGGFFTSKQHEKAAARFLFDDINFLKYGFASEAEFLSNKTLKHDTYKTYLRGIDWEYNIRQYWEFGLKPLLEKGTLSKKRLLELLDVRCGPGESETKTNWLKHLIFFEAITPEQVNLYQNSKRK